MSKATRFFTGLAVFFAIWGALMTPQGQAKLDPRLRPVIPVVSSMIISSIHSQTASFAATTLCVDDIWMLLAVRNSLEPNNIQGLPRSVQRAGAGEPHLRPSLLTACVLAVNRRRSRRLEL